MELLLRLLGFYFIMVALPRVAVFANRFIPVTPDGWGFNPFVLLGVLFAIGLSFGVYAMTYFAASIPKELEKQDVTSLSPAKKKEYLYKKEVYESQVKVAKRAFIAMIAFALLDSVFNLAEVASVAAQGGYIVSVFQPVNRDLVSLGAVWAFGLFPTFAAALAGWVVSSLDQVPPEYRGGKGRALFFGKPKKQKKTSAPRSVSAPPMQPDVSDIVYTESEFEVAEPTENRGARIKLKKSDFLEDWHSGKIQSYLDEHGLELVPSLVSDLYGCSIRTAYRWLDDISEDVNEITADEIEELGPSYTVEGEETDPEYFMD